MEQLTTADSDRHTGAAAVPDSMPPPTGALVGYARASTRQPLDHQCSALTRAGCATVFADEPAGRTAARPGLTACLASLRPGDTLVVPSLERLARSVHELLGLVAGLCARGVGFRSLDEDLDTTSRGGQQESAVFTALARFLHDADTEAAQEGRVAARAGGQRLGRPPALTADQVAHARHLLLDPGATVSSVARTLGVGRSTVYRHLPELTGRTNTTRLPPDRQPSREFS